MMPLWSRMRRPLISGITSGTFGSMRKAEELSITTAPAFTAIGADLRRCRCRPRTARCRRRRRSRSVSSSIDDLLRRGNRAVLPAERALASAFSLPTRKPRLSMVAMNSAPTAPVTPAMATTGSSSLGSPSGDAQAIKKPRTFSGGASVRTMRSLTTRARLPKPRRASGFRRGFHGVIMARNHMGGETGRVNGFGRA